VLDGAGRLADACDAARRALELAESRVRRRQVETLAARLRAASPGDEAAQRALDQALRLLEPTAVVPEAPAEPVEAAGDYSPEPVVAEAFGVGVGAEPESEPASEPEPAAVVADEEAEKEAAPEPEPEMVAEPIGLGIALGAAAEAALFAGDLAVAHEGLLAAARAHRRAGRLVAAVDACYLAISIAPADPDIHLLLAELYLDRGWRSQAADKLLLLGRLADLDADVGVRERLCQLVAARLPDEPRVAEMCA
jgi:tetratricopeptide (TPR) repeat protein